ncbi:hypothetical protein [Roseibium sediminicola]|uniref:Sulfotransferase family protein n=1 Tax=Roseibium sediminicola TaxID=2933272 RepID=A0ABT0GYS8_9HYPH|nr:hypothetical protein [Roseibium sp. CAU 1639]MCK7613978.1 hypothetical protein [Roseibium sp. CAU 1639]
MTPAGLEKKSNSLSDHYSEIFVHVGIHRTGTSTLQKYLLATRDAPEAKGLDVVMPQIAGQRDMPNHRDGIRDYIKIHARLNRKPWFLKPFYRRQLNGIFQEYVDLVSPRAPVLVLSEENILGQAFFPERPGLLYPDAERNLLAIRTLTGANLKRVFLAVRSYPDFLLSYEIMREAYFGRGIGLDNLSAWAAGRLRGWKDIVEIMARVFPETDIEIWPYGGIRIEQEFTRLTGLDYAAVCKETGESVVNASATYEALAEIQRLRRAGRKPKKPQVDSILQEGAGQKIRLEDVFPVDALQRLTDLYMADMEAIGRLNNVMICGNGGDAR